MHFHFNLFIAKKQKIFTPKRSISVILAPGNGGEAPEVAKFSNILEILFRQYEWDQLCKLSRGRVNNETFLRSTLKNATTREQERDAIVSYLVTIKDEIVSAADTIIDMVGDGGAAQNKRVAEECCERLVKFISKLDLWPEFETATQDLDQPDPTEPDLPLVDLRGQLLQTNPEVLTDDEARELIVFLNKTNGQRGWKKSGKFNEAERLAKAALIGNRITSRKIGKVSNEQVMLNAVENIY